MAETTVEAVKAWMATKDEEHGSESSQIVECAETANQDFPGLESKGWHEGEEARWGNRGWYVYTNETGRLIGIGIYMGATEMQESFYEVSVVELEEVQVISYREKS